MSLIHALEMALVLGPFLIFVVLVFRFKKVTGEFPSEKTGGVLIYNTYEGTAALAFIGIAALNKFEYVANLGELRTLLVVLSVRAAWGAFGAIVEILRTDSNQFDGGQ